MIPKSEYLVAHKQRFVTLGLVREYHGQEAVQSFYYHMMGRTCIPLSDGTRGYYSHDYESWLHDFIQHKLRTRRSEPTKETPSPDCVVVEGNVLIAVLVCL